ncbi:hypothetical protein Tco_1066238 [Tanacetum coccineum]|uniref:Uncharacterized protein n=1 Tax=Tanacetum coccineum TaxID=301880 RepID=A0ABQ5HAU1_9ASTR
MDNSGRGRVVLSVVRHVRKQHHRKRYEEHGLLVKGSTHGGLNLNEEADGSGEEVREVQPIRRDRAKKKAFASSRFEYSSVAGGGLVNLKKENVTPVNSKIAELSESRAELLNRIQNLKNDLQSWRSKLDTQVKSYRDELSDLKKTLNVEVDQLRSEFQELRTTLQQQQEDVTVSLKNLGDVSGDVKDTEGSKVEGETI